MNAAAEPLLACRAVSKRFGGAVALEGVDFDVLPGEVHGLVGANGAGKSTLMKILAGVLPDHEGEIAWRGTPIALDSPQAALEAGVAMVYQELSGIGQLSVAENLFLGRQPTSFPGRIDWAKMRREAREQLRELQIDVDPGSRLDSHPLVVRQMVEIARGVHSGAKLLILDEPTSALSPPETRRLFELIRRLRDGGTAIVFISHFLDDVLEICDRVTVLRDARLVETVAAADTNKHQLIEWMLGREAEGQEAAYERKVRLPPATSATSRLKCEKLSRDGLFDQIDLSVAPGECVALCGYVGAGHQELVRTIAGVAPTEEGRVLLDDAPLPPGKVDAAVKRGVVLVAADRGETLCHNAEIYKNVTLAHLRRQAGGWLRRRREVALSQPLLERVGCRPADPLLPAGSLSGGNQQKVVLAKWLLGPIRVLLLEEPTRGMDVHAKEEVMRLVEEQKQAGAAVLLATTEPELAISAGDRVVVMSRGRIAREFVDCEVDAAAIMHAC